MMKKAGVLVLLIAFCLAVCLAACGSGPDGEMPVFSSHESAGQEASSATEPPVSIEYAPDLYDALYETYLHEMMQAGMLLKSWPDGYGYLADSMTAYFGLNYLKENPGYTGDLNWSRDEVFTFVNQRFENNSNRFQYDWKEDTYSWDGVTHNRAVHITKATRTGPILTIAYTYSEKDDDETPAANCEIKIRQMPDYYQYISNAIEYTQYKTTLDQSDLDELTIKYVWMLGAYGDLLRTSWDDAEDLGQDVLIDFLSYNRLIDPADMWEVGHIPYAKGDLVEKLIRKYFDVSVEYLRASEFYNPEDHTYLLVQGGGGGSAAAFDAKTEGDILYITSGYIDMDDKRPSACTTITIRLKEDGFIFVSNEFWRR